MIYQLRSLALGAASLSAMTAASALPRPPTSRNPRAAGSGLTKRDGSGLTMISMSCGGFSSADIVDTLKNVKNLDNDDEKVVAANSCNRVGCYNTSGVYVCNDNDSDITVTNGDASAVAQVIGSICAGDVGEGHHPTDGQMFIAEKGGFNVVVGFCDNNEDVATLPSSYTPPGPNGYSISCGGNDADACDLGTCNSGTLAVATAAEESCNEYLGANTVGVNATYTYAAQRLITDTYSVGFSLGIDSSDLSEVSAQAGFQFSYSHSVTTGTSSGVSQICGPLTGAQGLFSCDLQITPGCVHLTGTCQSEYSNGIAVPFDTIQPQTDKESGLSVYAPAICTCTNCCDWANPAAPALKCFEDCPTCEPLPGDVCPS